MTPERDQATPAGFVVECLSLLGFNTFILRPQGAVSHGEQVSPEIPRPATQMMDTGFLFWHR